MVGGEINFAGTGGSGSEDASLRRQTNESEGRDESVDVQNKSRHLEDVVDSSETRGGCTDEANMVEGCGVGEDCLFWTRARLVTAI